MLVWTALAPFACVTSDASPPGAQSFDGGGYDVNAPPLDGALPDGTLPGDGGAPDGSVVTDSGDGATTFDAGPVHFAYVCATLETPLPDGGPQSGVFGYAFDPTTGAIAPFDTDAVNAGFQGSVPAGKGPVACATTPNSKFLYAANNGDQSVSAYAVDTKSGALTPLGTQATAGATPTYLVADPAGKHLYVSNFNGKSITVYDIAADGTLTAQAATATTLVWPRGTVLSPAGDLLFVTNVNSDSLSSFKVDPGTGALSNRLTVSTPGGPSVVVHHPTKPVLYVTGPNGTVVYAVSYDATGAMNVFGSQSVTTASIEGLAIDPGGAVLYVGSTSASTLYTFPLDGLTGGLAAPVAHPLVNGVGGTSLEYDPDGKLMLASYGINFPLIAPILRDADGGFTYHGNGVPNGIGAYHVPIVVPQ